MEVMAVLIYVTFKYMSEINTQARVPAYGEVHMPKKNTVTKIAGIVVVILLILFAFAFWNRNTSDKVVVPATGVAQEGERIPAVGIIPPETLNPNSSLPAVAMCPSGEVMNEEKGECEPVDKIPDEVGPVGEPAEYGSKVDYTKYLFPCIDNGPKKGIVNQDIDSLDFFARVNYFKSGEKLNFSIGYFLDNDVGNKDKWRIWRIFISDEYNAANHYFGCFTKPDDPDYCDRQDTGFGFYVDENSVDFQKHYSKYRNEETGKMHYLDIGYWDPIKTKW